MLKYEIFIWKSAAINGFSTSSIMICKVTTLKQKQVLALLAHMDYFISKVMLLQIHTLALI